MKLIKTTKGHYILIDDTKETNDKDFIVGTTRDTNASKLSIKNCESIELGYDLDEIRNLAKEDFHSELGEGPVLNEPINSMLVKSYVNGSEFGFKKAIELLTNKKFTEKDIRKAINFISDFKDWTIKDEEMIDKYGFSCDKINPVDAVDLYIQSIQKKEWDVFIDKREVITGVVTDRPGYNYTSYFEPRLDSDGCLILKKK
jgi:hypothetical protein